jgi:hypothetical protein
MQVDAEHQTRRMGAKVCYAYADVSYAHADVCYAHADVCYAHADVCYAYADVCRCMRSTKRVEWVRRYVGPITRRSEIRTQIRAKFIQDPKIGGGRAEGHLSIVPYVSIRQHTSAYVSIRGAEGYLSIVPYVSIRQHTSAYVSIRQRTSAYGAPKATYQQCLTSAYVSIRQHTSAYVSVRQHTGRRRPPINSALSAVNRALSALIAL